jgi:RND family efflux transporter MFP subunit
VPAVRADEKEVVVSPAIEREVTEYADYTGRTAASQTVEVRARVTGYLTRILFRDGSRVKKGELLYEIDPRPYKLAVDQAEGQLRRAEAGLKLARADLERARVLQKNKAITPEEVAVAEGKTAQAEAEFQAARANLELQKLYLDFTRVVSPIDGRVGRTLVDAGNLVKAEATHLTTILSVDPVYAYFDLDEGGLLRFRKAFSDDEKGVVVAMALVGEKGFRHKGLLDYMDSQVNPTAGTVRMRVVLPNPKGDILPGMFARCRVTMGKPYKALLIPEKALLPVGGGDDVSAVLVVDDKNEIHQRRVTVGSRIGELRVVREGLKPGDQVIVEGLKKVKPGEVVKPRQAPRPEERRPKEPE